MTRQKLLQFGCEVLIHTPYSPDISPPIIHLFQSLPNFKEVVWCNLNQIIFQIHGLEMALVVKNPLANVGDIRVAGLTPGLGGCPGGGCGNPLKYSCLENAMDRGA